MLFNSINFILFFVMVFCAYWALRKYLTIQNLLLLVASFFFYACWDWRFLFLLIFSITLDYFTGLKMADAADQKNKKIWFWLSIGINLGFLGVFKYYNFFADSLADLLASMGIKTDFWTLQVILPVGISFYTFHGLSYVIDIYKDRIKPERNFVTYAVFVSFFPLLVAGPIERATHLLPQLKKERVFQYQNVVDGLRQMLWGFFKKIVIADSAAQIANELFNHPDAYNGTSHLIGAIFFTFQIYGDFSGYSDIALGTARMMGIDLLKNFNYPYFSRDIAEFWRRWHISLSSWFRDYLYFPLGGSKGNKWMQIRNTFIIFLVSGFWHGANWTFVFWGFLNALYFMPLLLMNRNRNNLEIVAAGRFLPSVGDLIRMGITFTLTVVAWIFFRAESMTMAVEYLAKIISGPWSIEPGLLLLPGIKTTALFIAFGMLIEWMGRDQDFALKKLSINWPRPLRWAFYYLIIGMILYSQDSGEQQFIYFQF